MKKHMYVVAGVAVIASTVFGLGVTSFANAQSNTSSSSQTTANTQKKRDKEDRHLVVRARLNQAVRDGTITSSQKTAFITELKTLRSQAKSDLGSHPTKDQRQAERAKLKSELQTWASTNNFPLSKIFPKIS